MSQVAPIIPTGGVDQVQVDSTADTTSIDLVGVVPVTLGTTQEIAA